MTLTHPRWRTAPLVSPEEEGSVSAALRGYATARGCRTDEEVVAFLKEEPELGNPLARLPDWDRAVNRVLAAVAAGETITLFGDYDVDGVTSVSIMVDLLRCYGHQALRVYLPDRMTEDYGLTAQAVEACVREQSPKLMIVLDCGSNSHACLDALRQQGIDTIVLDHHQVLPAPAGGHPAFAHLNPKGFTDHAPQAARELSAAGLAFFFADGVANATKQAEKWRRDRAVIISGLGTLCDVMPLTSTNRALVKNSLARINNRHLLTQIPGLLALAEVAGVKRFDAYDYGFKLGPRLNASGRLAHAKESLRLLCIADPLKSYSIAESLDATNKTRRALQDEVLEKAVLACEKHLACSPATKVLFVHDESWHPGIIGIVAGKLRERFQLPTIVAGKNTEGYWKGSGRSVPGVDLGRIVTTAVQAGVLIGGGGHALAAGVKMKEGQPEQFTAWLAENTSSLQFDTTPVYETLGRIENLPTNDQVVAMLGQLAPFGAANPEPHFVAEAAIIESVEELHRRADGTTWALKARVTIAEKHFVLIWADVARAAAVLKPGARVTAIVQFARDVKNGTVYDQWKVVDAAALP